MCVCFLEFPLVFWKARQASKHGRWGAPKKAFLLPFFSSSEDAYERIDGLVMDKCTFRIFLYYLFFIFYDTYMYGIYGYELVLEEALCMSYFFLSCLVILIASLTESGQA